MGFSPQLIAQIRDRQERRSQRTCVPGWHVVEIVGYRRSPSGRVGTAVFDLRDDRGREQTVEFSLSIPVLRDGDLLRFWDTDSPTIRRGCTSRSGSAWSAGSVSSALADSPRS